MPAEDSRGMKDRALTIWFMWCSLAGFGVILPLAINPYPQHELLVHVLRAFGGVGFIVGLVALIRSSGESAPAGAATPAVDAPRILSDDPLGAGEAPLTARIDLAAAASDRYDRTLGLLYLHVESYAAIASARGVHAAEAAMDFIVAMTQLLMRDTDRCERIGEGRVVICLPLLPDRATLLGVRERVAQALGGMQLEALEGRPIVYEFGMALYRTHGATGRDVLAHARADCEAARARTHARSRRAA